MKNKKYSFLDPVHGNIELNANLKLDCMILNLIESPEFQRLRRIRQLGFSYMTFYGAESSRFVHSIGTFKVARKILKHLQNNQQNNHKLDELSQAGLLAAALLHDIGHGPFSHSSEPAFNFEHESWTAKIILGKTQINQVLSSFDKELPKVTSNILSGQFTNNANESWLSKIVSSQFDCDRADYLLRDSFQTGTKYGVFHLERIIQSLELYQRNGKTELIINEKGLNAVEDYLFARYSMYLQVYHHRKTLSADALFTSLVSRARDLLQSGCDLQINQSLQAWLLNPHQMELNDFWNIDDVSLLHYMKQWASKQKNNDPILQDLSLRLLNRKLLKTVKLQNIKQPTLNKIIKSLGPEKTKYYCKIKECREFPYNDQKKPIIVKKDGRVQELSKASSIAKALLNKDKELDVEWLFFPAEFAELAA